MKRAEVGLAALGLAALVLVAAAPAAAHTGASHLDGFGPGFAHPLLGLDHALAMGAVGLWAGLVGGRAIWVWPLAFVGVMILGALVGWAGVPVPGAEPLVALSVVLLGLAVAVRAPLSTTAGVLAIGVFALFHGVAHGTELPAAGMLASIAGFAAATALLHGAGVALGLVLTRRAARTATMAGGAVALAGLVLLVG